MACEARWVLAQPFEKRAPYLDLVEKRRGRPARMALQAVVVEQFNEAKAASAAGGM